jgi:hypothetical protein
MKPLPRQELRREAARTFVKTCAVHVRAAACDVFYEEVAEQMYGRIGGQEVLKAATAPADSTTDHWASELAGYGQMIVALAPASAAARLIAGGIQVDMTGCDMIGLPSRTTLATDGAWVAEGAPIPARKQAIADAIPLIRPRKLAVLVAFTREMAEISY